MPRYDVSGEEVAWITKIMPAVAIAAYALGPVGVIPTCLGILEVCVDHPGRRALSTAMMIPALQWTCETRR
jgi:hypothetical protein